MFVEKFLRVVLKFLTRNFWTYAEFRDEKPSKLCNTSRKRASLSNLRFRKFWKTNLDVCWKFSVCCFEFFNKKFLDLCEIWGRNAPKFCNTSPHNVPLSKTIHKLFKGKIGLSAGEFQCLPKKSTSGLMRNLATKKYQFRPKFCNISSKKVSFSKTFHKLLKVKIGLSKDEFQCLLENFGVLFWIF